MLPVAAIVRYFVYLFFSIYEERVCLMTESFCPHDIFLISN